jgi:hypothetical protein
MYERRMVSLLPREHAQLLMCVKQDSYGQHVIDDEVLIAANVKDRRAYRAVPGDDLLKMDLFVPPEYHPADGPCGIGRPDGLEPPTTAFEAQHSI